VDESLLFRARKALVDRRNSRPQPARDDKVLADWNGLLICGFAQAHRATGDPIPLKAARDAFAFVSTTMADGDRLAHSFMDGHLVLPGLATDYANMIAAAIELFAATGETPYLDQARKWFGGAERYHFDAASASYRLNATDSEPLFATPYSVADEATPAATGTMASNAIRLFMLTSHPTYRSRADEILASLPARVEKDVVGSAGLQAAYDTALRGRLAFVIGPREATEPLEQESLREADPAFTIAHVDMASIPANHPAYGKRSEREGAVFLCDALRCMPPILDAETLGETLRTTRRGLA
jgi:uncharacterized protein YyaL (SSP411 family)